MKPAAMDAEHFTPTKVGKGGDALTLDAFDRAQSDVPHIREAAPSVRSETSEASADALTLGQLDRECRRVFAWFAAQTEGRTRHDCADALYHGNTGSSCARINALVGNGWLREVGRNGKRSTLRVTTPAERTHFLRFGKYPEVAA